MFGGILTMAPLVVKPIEQSGPPPAHLLCAVGKHCCYGCASKALADYWSADNWHPTIGRLPINTKSYKNLTCSRKRVVGHDSALHITVKPALDDRPFVKPKIGRSKQVVAQ